MVSNNTPLERVEQARFVDWLESQGLLFTATAQSTYTTSWNQKRLNRATGLRKGLPDMVVIIPADKSHDGLGRLVFIEMKRLKGGLLSPQQKFWIAALESIGSSQVVVHVTKGADAAITTVSTYLKSVDSEVF